MERSKLMPDHGYRPYAAEREMTTWQHVIEVTTFTKWRETLITRHEAILKELKDLEKSLREKEKTYHTILSKSTDFHIEQNVETPLFTDEINELPSAMEKRLHALTKMHKRITNKCKIIEGTLSNFFCKSITSF